MTPGDERLNAEPDAAEVKAWTALARYKFLMFGYWAGLWIHLNRIAGGNRPNPWRRLVQHARSTTAASSAGMREEDPERRDGVDSQTEEAAQETTQEFPPPEKIADMAIMVAKHLRARRETREHESYSMIYEDGLIAVRVEKHVPNVEIFILRNGEHVPVFGASHLHHNQPRRYNPGGWTRYLEKLADRAQEVQEEEKAAQAAEERLEEQGMFGTIDNSDLFPAAQGTEQEPETTYQPTGTPIENPNWPRSCAGRKLGTQTTQCRRPHASRTD